MSPASVEEAFARVVALALGAGLPGIETGTSHGAPALRVRNKPICAVKDAGTLSLSRALEEKALLIEAAPRIYYETDHFKGWPWVLVRLPAIRDEELAHRLVIAWRARAGKRLVSRYDAAL